MLAYFLFFIYLLSGTILLHIIIRRRIFPFTIYHTASLMFFKIFMGCLYGWVFLRYYGGDDTWNYFNESKDATNLLMIRPAEFFREFLPSFSLHIANDDGWTAFLFYVNHFERWFMIKGLGILNLFTRKNYYCDTLLFEFLTVPGQLYLFKLLARVFPQRTGMNFLLIFFIPSVVFWCSGIRAEAFLLLSIVTMIYSGYRYAKKANWRSMFGILSGFAGILLFRYQFLLVFIPGFIAYIISLRQNASTPVYFKRIYVAMALLFLGSLFLSPPYQLSAPVRKAQESFFKLKGNTRYRLDSLEPGVISFTKILPQATVNSLFRPYPWEGKTGLQSLSSIDVIFMVIGLIVFLIGPSRQKQISHPIYWLFLFYAITQIVAIGYAVPFPGAIVRYRSIPFLFLILFLYAGNPLLQQKLRYWIFKLH